jgi:hypothetical protein
MPRLERFRDTRGKKAGIHTLKVKAVKAQLWRGAALEIRADKRGDFAPDFFRVSGSEDAVLWCLPQSRP